jgi:putative addiction module CopG family antidote
MTIHLPHDLEMFIREQVTSGLFASFDEAIAEAVRRLRQQHLASSPGKVLTPEDVDRQLLARGLLSRLPDPSQDVDDEDQDDLPVPVEGEPVSETIIRERR